MVEPAVERFYTFHRKDIAMLNQMRLWCVLLILLAIASHGFADDDAAADAASQHTHSAARFEFTLLSSWKPLPEGDLADARREFAPAVERGIQQYAKDGFPRPRMTDFRVFQKAPDVQVLIWELELPPQEDFLSQILATEKKSLETRRSQLVSGECDVIKLEATPVVRVQVTMKNGATATNIHYWNESAPTRVSVFMCGIRPTATNDTRNEAQIVLASLAPIVAAKAPEYTTAVIGGQEWMAQNLDVATFRNGDPIPEAKSADEWKQAFKNESAAWCYYDNDPKNGEQYGKLYNWYAVNDPRGLAPDGWHVPTDAEWQAMIKALGGMGAAFEKMKDPAGFAAIPAGARDFQSCAFHAMNNITFWWSADKTGKWNAWYHAMHFGFKQLGRDNGGMNAGHSVRCVKDKKE